MQRIIKNNLFPSKNNEYPLFVISNSLISLFYHYFIIILSLFYHYLLHYFFIMCIRYHHIHYSIVKSSCAYDLTDWTRSIPVERSSRAVMDWNLRLVGSAPRCLRWQVRRKCERTPPSGAARLVMRHGQLSPHSLHAPRCDGPPSQEPQSPVSGKPRALPHAHPMLPPPPYLWLPAWTTHSLM